MATYKITSKAGIEFGTYEGDSAEDAIRAMHRDAGYASDEQIEAALGQSFESLAAQVIVEVVS